MINDNDDDNNNTTSLIFVNNSFTPRLKYLN